MKGYQKKIIIFSTIDSIISIPTQPELKYKIDSLNVSNACSIALYEHFKNQD